MIENTSLNPKPEWLMGGNPIAIKKQEAKGQVELVNSSQLPINIQDKEELEKMGIKFGKVCENDILFCHAELPEGWKKEKSDHSMWSYILDEKGEKKAEIFYKAVFYDRHAFIRLH